MARKYNYLNPRTRLRTRRQTDAFQPVVPEMIEHYRRLWGDNVLIPLRDDMRLYITAHFSTCALREEPRVSKNVDLVDVIHRGLMYPLLSLRILDGEVWYEVKGDYRNEGYVRHSGRGVDNVEVFALDV